MNIDDSAGLMWADAVRETRRGAAADKNIAAKIAALPFSTGGYMQPELRDAPPGYVAIDFETEDPTLLERGSAWAFSGIGDILGLAVAWEGFEAYYPVGHREGNVDRDKIVRWLTEHFRRDDVRFIAANACYDLGWAKRVTGLYPAGGIEDVQFMAALLDENRLSYSLDNIAQVYLGMGKNADVIKDIADKLSIKYAQVMGNLKHLAGPVIAPYAATDARVTYDLHRILLPQIDAEDLRVVHDLESDLIPMSVDMKRRGIRVDVDEAERRAVEIRETRIPELKRLIKAATLVDVEPWESETLARALASCGITCDRTRTGQPKVDQYALAAWAKTEPVAAHILALRKMSKIENTFLTGHILGHQHLGRIHADFNQLRSEREDGSGFGTVSGRFSSTAPNLQQIPTRDKEWGPLMRSLFLAEEGQQIASLDYSSQEPRLTVHFAAKARLPGAAEAVEKFRQDPRTDYHGMVAEIANIPRSQAKTINLGCFGPDTRVLTSNGVMPITRVTKADKLWDGVEWVTHQGLLDQGVKDTIRILGDLHVTTDHLILCESQWVSAIVLARDENTQSQALVTGSANLPSQDLSKVRATALKKSLFSARVDAQNTQLIPTIYSRFRLNVANFVGSVTRRVLSANAPTRGQCPKMITEPDFSIDCLQPSVAVTTRTIQLTNPTVAGALPFSTNGVKIKDSFSFMSEHCLDGMTRSLRWIEQITAGVMSLATCGSSRARKTTITDEPSEILRSSLRTYDIALAGPRSRYTVVTAAGPIIVHNCSYGMGGNKLAHSLGLPTEWMAVRREGGRTKWQPISDDDVADLRAHGVDCIEVAGDEAKAIMKKWEEGAPFVRGLYKLAEEVAGKRGYIRTLLGRRCRFKLGAEGKYAFTHKALNRLAQGSAADQTKRGMLDLWNMGHVPLLTVHDELVFSVDDEAEARRYSPVMENAVPLLVPSVVDVNLGKTWGDIAK